MNIRGHAAGITGLIHAGLPELTDEMCFIHSMTAKSAAHGPAENQMSTGFILEGFPGVGSWATYALGSECQNLPAFVAIPDPRGVLQTGSRHGAAGFLPAAFQSGAFTADKPIPHLNRPAGLTEKSDHATFDFLKLLNDRHLADNPGDTELAARISTCELAAKMQLAAAEVGYFSGESPHTLAAYGVGDVNRTKAGFARNCLLARRLLERDVRFARLCNGAYAMGEGIGNWDGHKYIVDQYNVHAPRLDQPAAARLRDLKERGLLKDTHSSRSSPVRPNADDSERRKRT